MARWTGNCVNSTATRVSTHHGSSYNSYLVRDKKTVLIDTVWLPYDKEFVSSLKDEIDLGQIDYIIINHGEVDHSGALTELMREIPNTPIYCTANAVSRKASTTRIGISLR